jgi:geranylgeranyl pyrophosphate synthase
MGIIQRELNEIDLRSKNEILLVLRNRGIDPYRLPLDFHLYYPFWLNYTFETIRKEEIAEELVKFNLWFSYHILVQDDIIDQKTSSKDFYKNVIYSDSFLFKALLKLNELMTKMTPDFRKNVMKTYEDYIDCILWEKEHMKSMNIYSETDIRNFGKKFSPLKINNLIFTYLSSQNPNFNYLESLNSFLENFHICMQIIDDVKDWKDDLKNKNFSFFLMEIVKNHNMYEKIDNIEEFEQIIYSSDIVKNTAKKSLSYLYLARSNISAIHNPYLNEFIKEVEIHIDSIILDHEQKKGLIDELSRILLDDVYS